MKRRIGFAAFALLLTVVGGLLGWRPWTRWRHRVALEEAASNLCACMLGRHGDVQAGLLAVRAGIIAKPDPADRLWPARCKPWGEAALVVLGEPDGSWTSESVLRELEPFWVRDPDPRVPLPEPRSFELTKDKLVPIVEGDDVALAIDSDRLVIDEALQINPDDRIERVPPPIAPSFPGHPNWKAIDGEPGAKRFWRDGSFFYDEAGHSLGDWYLRFLWARAFADGRLVAHVYIAKSLDDDSPEIWEYAPGKKLARAPFDRSIPFGSKSTTNIDAWSIYKHLGDGAATLDAIDFSRGVAAKPITLGPIERPNRLFARTYGTCRARGTFVDMDPSFVIRTKDGWKFAPLQQANHRIVSCEGDVAMVTEWVPLEIRKCNEVGCALVPFPRLDTGIDDAFAADATHLFQVVRDEWTIGVHVYALTNPKDAHHVAVLDQTKDFRLRVVAGRAIILVKKDKGWAAISVRPDGTVHAITM